jgi:hypothetical protein
LAEENNEYVANNQGDFDAGRLEESSDGSGQENLNVLV